MIDDVTVRFGADVDELLASLDSVETRQDSTAQGFEQQREGADRTAESFDRLADSATENARATAVAEQAADEYAKTTKEWKEVVAPVSRAFDSAVSGLIRGTESLSQAGKRFAQSLAISWAEAIAQMTAKWLAFEAVSLLKWKDMGAAIGNPRTEGLGGVVGGALGIPKAAEKAANTTKDAGQSAATTANTTALHSLTTAITSLNATLPGHSTALVANTTATEGGTLSADANTISTDTQSLSLDANAIATDTNTLSVDLGTVSEDANTVSTESNTIAQYIEAACAAFDVGTSFVPQDMVAQIHQGEIIVPPAQSEAIRAGRAVLGFPSFGLPAGLGQTDELGPVSGAAFGMSPSAGPSVQLAPTITIQALDAASVSNLFQRQGTALVKSLQRQVALGASLTASA